MKSRFFLNIIIRESSSIFKLFTSKDKTLLIGRYAFLILDLCFDIFNCIRWFNFQCDSFTCQSLNKYLHSSSKAKDKMKCRFFLDIVIRKGSSIFKLFTCKNKTLLIRGYTFFILYFSLNILNGIWSLNFKSDCFPCQSFDKNLHSSSKPQNQVKCGLFLNIIIRQCSSIFQLFASKN